MKRTFRVLMTGALLGALVVPAVQAQDKEELRIWVLSSFGDTVLNAWNQVEADFEAANPGIDVVLETRGDGRAQGRPARRGRHVRGAGHLLHVGRPRSGRRVRQPGHQRPAR